MSSNTKIASLCYRSLGVISIFMLGFLTTLGSNGGGGNGGDNGNGVPTDPLNITASNAIDVAGEAMDVFSFIDITEAVLDMPYGATINSRKPYPDLLLMMLEQVKDRLNDITNQGVNVAQRVHLYMEVLCDSGSMTFDWDDTNDNDLLSIGETIQITYNDCYESDNNSTTNGSMSMTVNALTGDPQNDAVDWSLEVTLQHSDFKQTEDGEEMKINGSITLTANNNTTNSTMFMKSEGTSITFSSDGEDAALTNYSISVLVNMGLGTYEADADYTLAYSGLGGVIIVVTEPVFSGLFDLVEDEPGNPTAGKMTITGAGNSTVTVEPYDDLNALISLDADGDDTFESTWNVSWVSLE